MRGVCEYVLLLIDQGCTEVLDVSVFEVKKKKRDTVVPTKRAKEAEMLVPVWRADKRKVEHLKLDFLRTYLSKANISTIFVCMR